MKRAHVQTNERTDQQSTRDEQKLKIICFKNGIQMPRDQNMNRIELNWMESEKKEHIHILKYLKRKSIHAIMYWKYELQPIDSFSLIPSHGRDEKMNHILLDLNNVAGYFAIAIHSCVISFLALKDHLHRFERGMKKEKLKSTRISKCILWRCAVCYCNAFGEIPLNMELLIIFNL